VVSARSTKTASTSRYQYLMKFDPTVYLQSWQKLPVPRKNLLVDPSSVLLGELLKELYKRSVLREEKCHLQMLFSVDRQRLLARLTGSRRWRPVDLGSMLLSDLQALNFRWYLEQRDSKSRRAKRRSRRGTVRRSKRKNTA
jgi:hypothetical protein